MSKHLERDLQSLEQELLGMSASVERMIGKAWQSVRSGDEHWAQEVIESDDEIDSQEVHIEEDCLKILALHQPVAIDLRRTATILKVNNDLERIADLAVNIAERSLGLVRGAAFNIPRRLDEMARIAQQMLHDALTALVELDADGALRICAADDQVDQAHAEVLSDLYDAMRSDSSLIAPAIHALAVARYVERIADHATNIAEDVIYLVHGDITRHRSKEAVSDEAETSGSVE